MNYRALLLAAAAIAPACAQPGWKLFACMAYSKDYVVGAPLPLSGLFQRQPGGEWKQFGYNHPYIKALDYDPRDPNVLYIAAGNGCIRSADGGRSWRITTSWDMTELQDVSVDPNRPDDIYLGLTDGIGVSRDQGKTWRHANAGIRRKYTNTIRVDRTRAGRVLAGAEQGIFLSEDAATTWRNVGADGVMVTDLVQSPHDGSVWVATTQTNGAYLSRDGGRSWTGIEGVPRTHTLHNAAFDPTGPRRMAISGWNAGLLLSEDGGRSWSQRARGLPKLWVWRVAFDPARPGRMLASVHEEALYSSDDLGKTWSAAGLEGTLVWDLAFVPEVKR